MNTRAVKRTQKEESEVDADDEVDELEQTEEHGYAVGGQDNSDTYLPTEGEDEFNVRPCPTPSPFTTDRVPVRHPIGM